jgi:hypothetical protein
LKIAAMARILAALLLAAYAGSVEGLLRQSSRAEGFVKALEFKHTLRVCNAYPYAGHLDVYRTKEKLTDQPMAYKACQEFINPGSSPPYNQVKTTTF